MNKTKENLRPDGGLSRKTSEHIDNIVGIFSPRRAYLRKAFRFSYDAIDSSRTRKKRTGLGGSADRHLTETNLYKLREINRELTRNNPLIEGLFETERDGIIGSGVKIQARTGDTKLNEDLEAGWKEKMLQKPCDVSGRFNFDQYLGIKYLTYRRDGDAITIFGDDKLQAVEGEQIGTPWGRADTEHFNVINGVAYSKKTKAVIGYYIGESDRKWGYIKRETFRSYRPDVVHHMFNPRRFSQSRGKPALTSAIDFVDKLTGYIDAELVAAKVNACFSMFVSQEYSDIPDPYTGGISDSGKDEDDNRLEKMNPGMILYGRPGEKAAGIGQTRPGALFDPFVQRILTFIGRPLCMPLMLITLDFSGATFMNARIAYQKIQDAWMREQNWIVKPFVSRVWRWRLQRFIDEGDFKLRDGIFRHEILCNRWPYIDPWKEAKADEQQLFNGTATRTEVCARQGRDFKDVTDRLDEEGEYREGKNLPTRIKKGAK